MTRRMMILMGIVCFGIGSFVGVMVRNGPPDVRAGTEEGGGVVSWDRRPAGPFFADRRGADPTDLPVPPDDGRIRGLSLGAPRGRLRLEGAANAAQRMQR